MSTGDGSALSPDGISCGRDTRPVSGQKRHLLRPGPGDEMPLDKRAVATASSRSPTDVGDWPSSPLASAFRCDPLGNAVPPSGRAGSPQNHRCPDESPVQRWLMGRGAASSVFSSPLFISASIYLCLLIFLQASYLVKHGHVFHVNISVNSKLAVFFTRFCSHKAASSRCPGLATAGTELSGARRSLRCVLASGHL